MADTLKPGPAPTGRDKIFDALYGVLGGKPENRWAADKLTTAVDWGTLGMLTGAYDGGQSLAKGEGPGQLAMALMPGAKPIGAAAKVATAAAREAKPLFSELGSLVAKNNEAGYNPPTMAQRGFDLDYRKAPQGDFGSGLEKDIDGRPLVARFVAGRRTVGGPDEALRPQDIGDIAQALTQVHAVPRNTLPRRAVAAYDTKNNAIHVADDLSKDQFSLALSHELGHALDISSKGVDLSGADRSARKIYHDLRVGQNTETRPGKFMSPEIDGYSSASVPLELNAEMIRAYMTNPNYVKSVSPVGAKAIREAINSDPYLSRIIQFNTPVGLLGLGAAAATQDPAQASP